MARFPSPTNPFGTEQRHPLEYAAQGSEVVSVSKFFNGVYAWMAAGLATTALVAWVAAQNFQYFMRAFGMGPFLALFIAEIALVMVISRAINKISAATATVLFMVYAALNGVMLSVIFLLYAHATILAAFVGSAGMFGVMSAYGYFTKTDLTTLGRMAMMAVIGIIIASVVNFFVASSAMDVIISYVGVLAFVALTAYDTQKLKDVAVQTQYNAALSARLSVVGSLMLYLDFINLFLMLLRLMGDRRR